MIKLVLAFYLLLFPRCEMMVSWLDDFSRCNDDAEHAARCYAASDWDFGGAPVSTLRDDWLAMNFIFHLPFVRTVSCWQAP